MLFTLSLIRGKSKVRQTIADLGGTMPERLAPAEDVKKVGRRLQAAIKNASKRIK